MKKNFIDLLDPTVPSASEDIFKVADGVWGRKDTMVNYLMIQSHNSSEWILVDCGLKWSVPGILEMSKVLFGEGSKPTAIVLTHGHFDHTGALPALLDHWDVPVYAHELELPYITGQSSYPPADPEVGGGMISTISFMFPQGPINISPHVRKLPGDGTIPEMPEWKVIHTPGHAPGHISLFRAEDSVLIAGDAFLTTKAESAYHALTFKESISGPPKYLTYDWTAARASVEKLAALKPSIAVTGHGRPMEGNKLTEELQNLLDNFDALALPPAGRYVNEPAVMNKFGAASWPERSATIPMSAKVAAYSALVFSAIAVLFKRVSKSE